MPTKSKLSLIKSPPSFEETHSKSSASESQDSVQEVLSGSDSEQTLMCQVCDKSFTVKCEYLVHKLKHEKLEDAVVKVFRHSLPAKLNVSELSPKKTVVSPENINKLLTKWIGEHAAQAYADAEHNISEITADLNEKSGENEEESEKSKEESEKSEAESEKSNEESEKSNEESEKSIEESEKSKEVETTEEVGKQDETSGKDENIEENHDSDKNEENEKEDQNPIEKPGEEAGEKKIVAKETNLGDNNTTSADMDEIKHDSTDDEATNELEKEVIPNDKDKSNDGEKLQESEAEKTIEVDESESDEDASPTSPVLVEPLLLSKENEPCSKTTDNLENGNENESNCEGATINEPVTEVLNKDKQSKSDCFDEFSNSGLVSPPVMTCEDLINILETNIADDEESTTEAREADKRKRENDSEEVTPRRKRVRFADEKEVFTPYQDDGVSLEKIDESDHSADPIEDVEDNETETVSE
ncbi:hypothetical protein QE152_g21774 [Popillia japonica]|uniref:C2H2-type domain-containing protein n=1 Tax=Popillia japonica TaxID=7064 RepID=A0AAW1KMY6_POPJA